MFEIQEELKKVPISSGVYLMHNDSNEIIYVGKAVNLRNRIRQYFQNSRNQGIKIDHMVGHIRYFEYIVTDSEMEALVLECNLIKEYHPKYNTMLMDDKSYPFIKVTVNEAFPRIVLTRQVRKDRAKYFGPYTNVTATKDTIELIRKICRVRSCRRNLPKDTGRERPCLYYHIHQCDAPCQGYVSEAEYRRTIDKALDFLEGHFDDVLRGLKTSMQEASDNFEYERAGEILEIIRNVETMSQKQKMSDVAGNDRDIVAAAAQGEDAVVQLFFIRGGRLVGRDHLYMKVNEGDGMEDVLSGFLTQFYSGTPYIPSEIVIQSAMEEKALIESWLSERKGSRVKLVVPQKGKKEKMMELAKKNVEMILALDKERLKREVDKTVGALRELERVTGIHEIARIESYDISNISGFASVGSMVVFENGKPKKNDYRKFRIKSVRGSDDYGSLREVLSRRFLRGLGEQRDFRDGQRFSVFPDVILMDGGKGQVAVAVKVLEELGIDIPVLGMVKDDRHRTRGVYYGGREIEIDRNMEIFHLITRIQDETHRFAIEFHRQVRGKTQVHSLLDDIPGVGPRRRRALMMNFESLDEIKRATVEELAAIPSMNRGAARAVYDFFLAPEKQKKEDPYDEGRQG